MKGHESGAADAGGTKLSKRGAGLFVVVFVVSLGVLLLWSSRVPTGPRETLRLADVAAFEPLVKMAARGNFSELSSSAMALGRSSSGDSALLLALAAWAKLSLGRLHVLSDLNAVRLPWLALAAFAPAVGFVALRPRIGLRFSLILSLTILLTLFALGESAVTATKAANVGWLFLILGPYLRNARAPGETTVARAPLCGACVSALAFGVALSGAPAMLWTAVIACVHSWTTNRSLARQAGRHGRALLPAFVILGLPIALAAFALQNPALLRGPAARWVSALLGLVFDAALPLASAGPAETESSGVPAWLLAAGVAGVLGVAHAAFSTRSAHRRSARVIVLFVVCGLAVSVLARWSLPPAVRVLAPGHEFALPFLAVAITAGAFAVWQLARAASGAQSAR